jgi:hypothetical protein
MATTIPFFDTPGALRVKCQHVPKLHLCSTGYAQIADKTT